MRESQILKEIKEIEDLMNEDINKLLKKVNNIKKQKENKINQIMKKCTNHTYNDKTTSLVTYFDGNKHYLCKICGEEFPLEKTIENYKFRNKNIESIPNNKLSENLKQLIDIITTDLKLLCIYQGTYETFFENQCYKQGYIPRKVFNLLCEYNIFEVSENNRGYVDIL